MAGEGRRVSFTLNGRPMSATPGASLAAVLLEHDVRCFRRSTTGEPRGPVCGMGICFECRVTIDGRPHQKACQIAVADGMEVRTDE